MTRFTELVGCRLPLQLAAMGGVGTVELAAAVTQAGGLGMVPAVPVPPDVAALESARAAGPIGVNFLMPFLDHASFDTLAPHADVVELFYGDPDAALVKGAHDAGALVSWQIGSVREARLAVDAGVDFVVAQGTEAGGHVRGALPALELVRRLVPRVDVPIVAAGAITTRAAADEALAAGADGVRVGTALLVADESGAHPDYVAALCAEEQTQLTIAFGGGWPDAPHRVLSSAITAAMGLPSDEPAGDWVGLSIPRWSALAPTRDTHGHVDAMALYAGTGVSHVTRRRPAAEIVAELVEPE
jgi:NAD(P)H-dependent flavin oxidoreductase YrpB (nitropropane dioxygenase family)